MKVVTWNVNNRVGTVSQQVQALGEREPDVVALQDVNYNGVARYIEAFRSIGLPHILHTLERQSQAVPTGVLLASCFPLSLLPDRPESVLWSQGVLYTRPREATATLGQAHALCAAGQSLGRNRTGQRLYYPYQPF